MAPSLALLILENGVAHPLRLVLDPGAELFFVKAALVKKLRLRRRASCIEVAGIEETAFGATQGEVQVRLKSLQSAYSGMFEAHVLERLTSALPTFAAEQATWEHLEALQLADPEFLTSRPVDILIGADVYGMIIEPGLRKGAVDTPIAQRTMFGWVILDVARKMTSLAGVHHAGASTEDVHELLTKFWLQEEVPAVTDSH